MKIRFTLFLLALFISNSIQAQIFVKHDAAGANDGSSWANAYIYLDDALNNSAPNDQIWVAAGIYKPGGATPSSDDFYTFPHDLELYGGFDGTETALGDRDWETNETILSGDHNSDDIPGNFDDNRSDNSLHVMWLTDTVTTASVIDGFTIRNGNTEPGSGSGNDRRGGGILTYGAPAVKNCYFTQNFGHFGGGLYPRGADATGVVIENCVFEENRGNNGGGIYINAQSGTITDCEFIDNTTMSTGGGVYNSADNGVMFTNCTFTGNESIDSRGGGIYNTTSPSTITNCVFEDNSAMTSSGGGLQVRHTDDEVDPIEVNVIDCTFEDNLANWGGGVGVYDDRTAVNFMNCEFISNTANTSGGGFSNAFGATSNVMNCVFEGNEADNGGAIYSQNDSAHVNINMTQLFFNIAQVGGAINITGDNEPGSTTPIPQLDIENCLIQFNTATEQAGGINMGNGNANITNSLFDANIAIIENDGIGGAMSINVSDTIEATINIMNTTMANNLGFIGAGIATWRDGTEGSSTINLQNTIMANIDGLNYEVEDGETTVVSNGGNLSFDVSMMDILTGTNDLNNTNPEFVFYGSDYHLNNNSPCVDAGIAAGAPLLDLDGLERVDEVDMGAYENQKLVNVFEIRKEFGKLDLFPNPVVDADINVTFESDWRGDLEISILNMEGKVLFAEQVEKIESVFSKTYNVVNLPKGVYSLTITNGKFSNSKGFVK